MTEKEFDVRLLTESSSQPRNKEEQDDNFSEGLVKSKMYLKPCGNHFRGDHNLAILILRLKFALKEILRALEPHSAANLYSNRTGAPPENLHISSFQLKKKKKS